MSEPARFGWGGIDVAVGPGCRSLLATLWDEDNSGGTVFVSGRSSLRDQGLLEDLRARMPAGTVCHEGIPPTPEAADVQALADRIQELRPSVIVAAGGGSVMDAAKVARVAASAGLPVDALFEGIPPQGAPESDLICLPTTSGTGSEVTPFATVWDRTGAQKRSLDTPAARATRAFVDPELAAGLPLELTRRTAGDALTHAMEALWSRRHSPVTDASAVQAIRSLRAGLRAFRPENSEGNPEARAELAWGALMAGMSISLTRTAAAHALSYALTMKFAVPHGVAVATLIPGVLRANLVGLDRSRRVLLRDAWEVDDDDHLIEAVEAYLTDNELKRPLSGYGIEAKHLEDLVAAAAYPGRLDNNLVELNRTVLHGILEGCL